MLHIKITLVMVTLIAAISASTAISADGVATCNPNEDLEFSDWKNWDRITPNPQQSASHSNVWVVIYTNQSAKRTYLEAGTSYAPCAQIVKAAYKDQQAHEFIDLTVMVKMSSGYDPDHNDWWYGTYDEAVTHAEEKGCLNNCITCHEEAAETDYLFSEDVMAIAGK